MSFQNSFRFINEVNHHDTSKDGMFYRGGWRTRDIALLNYSEPERGTGIRHGFWDYLQDLFKEDILYLSTLVTLAASRGTAIRLKAVLSDVLIPQLRGARSRFNATPGVIRVKDMRLFLTGTTEVQEQNPNNGNFVTTATFIHDNRYMINLADQEEQRRPRFLFNYDNFDTDDEDDSLQLELRGYAHRINEPTPRGVHRLKITLEIHLEWQTENDVALDLVESPSKRIRIENDDLLDRMWKDTDGKDFTVVSGADKEFKCHQIVLKGRSEMLEAMVASKMIESNDKRLVMVGSSDAGLELLMGYLYGKEIPLAQLNPALCLEFLQIGHMYQLNDLVTRICSFLLRKDGEWLSNGESNVDDLLGLYSFATKAEIPMKVQLGNNLLEAMAWLPSTAFLASPRFNEFTKVEANELLFKMLEIHVKYRQNNLE